MSNDQLGRPSFPIPELGISFSSDQLEYLNTYFTNVEQACNHALNSYYETMTPTGGGPNLLAMDVPGNIEAIMERLVQRIITGVGSLDSRFASKYVLSTGSTYEHYKINEFDEFDFMIRLDQLSSPFLNSVTGNPPCEFIEDPRSVPHGYARVLMKEESNKDHQWTEFMDEGGFLLPHKIRNRFYELVCWVIRAAPVSMAMNEVDETKLPCASGKVLDVGIISDVLHLEPNDHVYIGIGDPEQDIFPNPKEFSIKVSQDGPAVRLAVVIPPSDGVEEQHVSVDLTISIGVNKWPQASDFPDRIPHCHVDAIQSYRAGMKGCHVVCTGPHESITSEDSNTLWRISHSSAEMDMMTHFDHSSIPAKVMRISKILLACICDPQSFSNFGELFQHLLQKDRCKESHQVELLSTYVLKTLFLFELENYTQIEDWLESRVSLRVLNIFTALVSALKRKKQRSYFFPGNNILLRKGVDILACDKDCKILLDFLKYLHGFSYSEKVNILPNETLAASISFENEVASLWTKQIVNSKLHMDRELNSIEFTDRQMKYLNTLYSLVVSYARFRSQKGEPYKFRKNSMQSDIDPRRAGVELVYTILDSMFSQMEATSKSQYMFLDPNYSERLRSAITKILGADCGTDLLLEKRLAQPVIRVVQSLINSTKCEDPEFSKGLEESLRGLFHCSWVNGWFNEDIALLLEPLDLKKVKSYARRVLNGSDAQMEFEKAVIRNEEWARVLSEDLVTLGCIRLVFTPKGQRQIIHFINKFQMERHDERLSEEEILINDLARRFPSVTAGCEGPSARTIHCKLATDNPLRAVLDKTRRYGHHRTPGSLPNGLLRAGFRNSLDEIRERNTV